MKQSTTPKNATRTRINRFCSGTQNGMTLLEIVIAVAILAFASASSLYIIMVIDKSRNKALETERASLCASNEAERLRSRSGENFPAGDTSYIETIDKMNFVIERSIPHRETESTGIDTLFRQVTISVRRENSKKELVNLRLLVKSDK
jgi:prepilin-type N-terminal cleavage/methylation domain-containing protein